MTSKGGAEAASATVNATSGVHAQSNQERLTSAHRLNASSTQQKQQKHLKLQQKHLLLPMLNHNDDDDDDAGDNNNDNIKLNRQLDPMADNDTIAVNCKQEHFQEAKNQFNATSNMSSFCKAKLVLFTLMGLVFILVAILVAIFTINQLDNDQNPCQDSGLIQAQTFSLFATKTAYSTAHSKLANYKGPYSASGFILSPAERSLSGTHGRLVAPESGCKLRQFYFVGRHASRYPNDDEIRRMHQHLAEVQARISIGSMEQQNVTMTSAQEIPEPATGRPACLNPLTQYKQWKSFMNAEQADLVMDSGFDEQLSLARRLKELHPEMFDASKSKIHLGSTGAIRTVQTALAFIKEIDNFKFNFDCNIDQFPLGTSDQMKAHQITHNQCYEKLKEEIKTNKLSFHKQCSEYNQDQVVLQHHLNINDPTRTKFIVDSVTKKLQLPKDEPLTHEQVKSLYKFCKYESAYVGSSIWCSLFNENELKFYEFESDIDDFYNQTYGHPDQMRSACPITTDLVKSMRATSHRFNNNQTEAFYYFTHSQAIQRILAASIDLSSDPAYTPKTIVANLNAGSVPNDRKWRSSLLSPFSANLAYSLYECPNAKASSATNENDSDFYEIDVGSDRFKVVASINERPFQLEGCSGIVCDLNELILNGRLNSEKKCKLEEICRTKVVVT